jgi:hypothetical protein
MQHGSMAPKEEGAGVSDDLDRFDYDQVLQNYRLLTEVRFKLVAFVPPLAGAAIALLSTSRFGRWEHVFLCVLGFVVSVGLVMYDQRNSTFYDQLIGRAEFLENELKLGIAPDDVGGGQFSARGDVRRYLFGVLPTKHDRALALVYSPILAGWLYPALRIGWPARPGIAAVATAVLALGFYLEFERLDGTFGKRAKYWPGPPPVPDNAQRVS